MQRNGENKGLRLLSLDGGGVRGLSALQIIKQLMNTIDPDNPPKPCEVFDMIGGTSTGGLIAIMLGRLQMDVDSCIDAYTKLSDGIFQKQKHRVSRSGTIQGRFDTQGLERSIKEVIREQGLGVDELLKDDPRARCKVFVCAIRKEITQPVHLRSYRYRGGGSLYPIIKIWEACRATSAATSFFDPITVGPHGNEFVDGAVGSNNPVQRVFTEAATLWDVEGRLPEHLACLVSIGTGIPAARPYGDKFWEIAKSLVAIATESEQTAASFAEVHSDLDDGGRYYRFNVMQGLQGVEVEDAFAKPTIVAATDAYLEDRQVYKKMKACGDKLAPTRATSLGQQPSGPFHHSSHDHESHVPFSEDIDTRRLGQRNLTPYIASISGQAIQRWKHVLAETPLDQVIGGLSGADDRLMLAGQQIFTEILIEVVSAIAIDSAALLNTNQKLPESSQGSNLEASDSILNLSLLSPDESFRTSVFLRNRRRLRPAAPPVPFWLAPKFQRWKDGDGCSLLMIKGTFHDRFAVKDFCIDAIEIVRESGVPVLWALKTVAPGGGTMAHGVSAVEVLKSLVSQALRVPTAARTEGFMATVSNRIAEANTEEEWLNLLGFALTPIREVIVVVDVELFDPPLDTSSGEYSMPMAFLTLFGKLAERNANTTVKVIMVSYGSSAFSTPCDQDLVIAVGRAGYPSARNIRCIGGRLAMSGGMGKLSLRQAMAKRR